MLCLNRDNYYSVFFGEMTSNVYFKYIECGNMYYYGYRCSKKEYYKFHGIRKDYDNVTYLWFDKLLK